MLRQLLASVFANGLRATVVRSPYSGRMYKEPLQGPTRRLAIIRLHQTPLGVRVFQATLAWRMFNRNRLPSPKLRLHASKRLYAAANRLAWEVPIILAKRR
jgi:hypothetical protein